MWTHAINRRLASRGIFPLLRRRRLHDSHIHLQANKPNTKDPTSIKKSSHSRSQAQTDPSIHISYPPKTSADTSTASDGLHIKPTLPLFSLEGKVTVMTGGARGLGLTMGQALINNGADLAIVDINKEEATQAATSLLSTFRLQNPNSKPPKITTHNSDISSPPSINLVIPSILSSHTKIDILVTSAGIIENFPATSYPPERMRHLWAVNVDGTYNFAVAVARHLMDRKAPGSFIFIGSMSGCIVNVPQPQAPYNAAKAAVRHLAASLAVEWAGVGIRVNCISPGYMLTALTQKILTENPSLEKDWLARIPAGRMGRPEDLMGAVVFLASDASAYVTGADLRVDGGYTVI